MIDKALGFIVAELNAFLGVRYPSSEDHAVLASLTHPDGSAPPHTANRLVVSLVNLEREASAATADNPIAPAPTTSGISPGSIRAART